MSNYHCRSCYINSLVFLIRQPYLLLVRLQFPGLHQFGESGAKETWATAQRLVPVLEWACGWYNQAVQITRGSSCVGSWHGLGSTLWIYMMTHPSSGSGGVQSCVLSSWYRIVFCILRRPSNFGGVVGCDDRSWLRLRWWAVFFFYLAF